MKVKIFLQSEISRLTTYEKRNIVVKANIINAAMIKFALPASERKRLETVYSAIIADKDTMEEII